MQIENFVEDYKKIPKGSVIVHDDGDLVIFNNGEIIFPELEPNNYEECFINCPFPEINPKDHEKINSILSNLNEDENVTIRLYGEEEGKEKGRPKIKWKYIEMWLLRYLNKEECRDRSFFQIYFDPSNKSKLEKYTALFLKRLIEEMVKNEQNFVRDTMCRSICESLEYQEFCYFEDFWQDTIKKALDAKLKKKEFISKIEGMRMCDDVVKKMDSIIKFKAKPEWITITVTCEDGTNKLVSQNYYL